MALKLVIIFKYIMFKRKNRLDNIKANIYPSKNNNRGNSNYAVANHIFDKGLTSRISL